MICGIDEAGRGPVIGPLVMCGVSVEENKEDELISLGIKDSKLLTPEKRKVLCEIIKARYKYHVIVVLPKEIDEALDSPTSNLNLLETIKMAMIVNKLAPSKAIIDAPSTNIPKFVETLKTFIKVDTIIQAEHKADLIHPVVSAASIVAKVTRDEMIEEIKRTHNINFGSGYPADPLTKEFLANNYKNKNYDFFRKTWASYKNLSKPKQKGLGDF